MRSAPLFGAAGLVIVGFGDVIERPGEYHPAAYKYSVNVKIWVINIALDHEIGTPPRHVSVTLRHLPYGLN
ncbi:hypothetical protein ANO14919_070410 [Xylariales sp. No.14919]|nr:hypothetical protein ANO14919_070410 [Xylariales sp. No.14919]